jgi:hypothetical protein
MSTTITEHTQTESHTLHRVATQSPEYRRFLRTLVQTYDRLKYFDRWSCFALLHEGGRLQFCRTVHGDIGQPNQYVKVETSLIVTTHYNAGNRSEKGAPLMPCNSIHIDEADTRLLVRLLLAHPTATLYVDGDHGSQNTEVLGMTFYRLCLHLPAFGGIRIGNDTIVQDTRVLTSGSVMLR